MTIRKSRSLRTERYRPDLCDPEPLDVECWLTPDRLDDDLCDWHGRGDGRRHRLGLDAEEMR